MATGRVPTTANSPLTAKGDLFGYSTTQARVPVGSDGETLVADSSASTGLRWQTGVNRNFIINGGFDIWQRGTSFTNVTANVYTADRWACGNSSANTFSRQSSGLAGLEYCIRVQRTNGSSNTNSLTVAYNLESVDSIPLQGKIVTVSFYARKSSTASSSTLSFKWFSGTGTNQNLWNGAYTGETTLTTTTVTLTDSWQRFTFTNTMPSNATQTGFYTDWIPSGTAGAADYVEQTGFQLEYGLVATNFKRAGNTLAGEFAAACRYYQRFTSANNLGTITPYAFAGNSTTAISYFTFPVSMRSVPTAIDSSNLTFENFAGSLFTMSSIVLWRESAGACGFYGTISGGTGGQVGRIASNGAGGYVGFSAEL